MVLEQWRINWIEEKNKIIYFVLGGILGLVIPPVVGLPFVLILAFVANLFGWHSALRVGFGGGSSDPLFDVLVFAVALLAYLVVAYKLRKIPAFALGFIIIPIIVGSGYLVLKSLFP
ncbi:hypothetical protein EPO05_04370 [Patescibacteria group bacterium]|nr:MAG: hypothetical protein EPO05_04370 [Patescibacteria group bacterium]